MREEQTDPSSDFFVVGIGASAGGLEAIEAMFEFIEPELPAAFVVVQHLSPDFESLMDQLLARHTPMQVQRAEDGVVVSPSHVYLIPPRKDMRMVGGKLQLSEQRKQRSPQLPIDIFFHSLAEDLGERAIGVILSGTGSDGSRGVKAIKAAGGMVMVQDEETAKFDGMPISAIAAQAVDVVLPPQEMGVTLKSYLASPSSILDAGPQITEEPVEDIIDLILRERGIDLNRYKLRTVQRRMLRRMGIVQKHNLFEYRQYLLSTPTEVDHLIQDLLIGVTEFFRDSEAYDCLGGTLEELCEAADKEPLRIWATACSTGEEVYSLGMLLEEHAARRGRRIAYKIFGTDINADAIARASEGVFPFGIQDILSPERLENYFERTNDGYRIVRSIRDRVVFAEHDLCRDPPFTRMHLVTCRNMLIYLTGSAQTKAMQALQFSLVKRGVLFLGPSETLGEFSPQFEDIDRKWRIYRKLRDNRKRSDVGIPRLASSRFRHAEPKLASKSGLNLERICSAFIASNTLACLLLDTEGLIVHVFGDASSFLKIPPGRATLDFRRMLSTKASTAISTAMHRAKKYSQEVRYATLALGDEHDSKAVSLTVKHLAPSPQKDESELYMVLIEDPAEHPSATISAADLDEQATLRIRQLEDDLLNTQENLQSTIEELETTHEELQSANEELLASNEELQSTNEELHSVNEELYTVNAEHHRKIEELTEVTGDMENLLRSTGVGTIFLDQELRIRKYTPQAAEVVPILPTDVARPIGQLSNSLKNVDLQQVARQVLESGKLIETETLDQHNMPRLVRVLPYSSHGEHRGVVLTFVDISKVKAAQQSLEESELRFSKLAEHLDEAFWMTTPDGGDFTYVSPLFEEYWQVSLEQLKESADAWLGPIQAGDREEARKLLDPEYAARGYATEVLVARGDEWRNLRLAATPVLAEDGQLLGLTGTARDLSSSTKDKPTRSTVVATAHAERDAIPLAVFLQQELARSDAGAAGPNVLLVQLNGFRRLEDAWGREGVRFMAREVIQRLRGALTPNDVVHTLGNYEVAIGLTSRSLAQAFELGQALREAATDSPIEFAGRPIVQSISISVALVLDPAKRAEEVLRICREAFFNHGSEDDRVLAATDKDGLPLRNVPTWHDYLTFLESSELTTFYQQVHQVESGEVVASELLSRGPLGPFHTPESFLRLTMDPGHQTRMDLQCLASCLRVAQREQPAPMLTINLWPKTLLDPAFDALLPELAELGRKAPLLVELSEAYLPRDLGPLADRVASLRDAGLELLLDDASGSALCVEAALLLRPQVIKLSQTITSHEAPRPPYSIAKLQRVARACGARLFAKGIETQAQRDELLRMGIHYAQGFLWSSPEPLATRN